MDKSQFIGMWRLVSFEFRRVNGRVTYPYGKTPLGLIAYDAAGTMALQIYRADCPHFASGDIHRGTPEEIRAAYHGSLSYFGAYEVVEQEQAVIHHVTASSFPNWVGTDQKRYYDFSNGELTLRTPPLLWGGTAMSGVLLWRRIPAAQC